MSFTEKLTNHSVSKNLLALVISQVANYLFPLLAFPILAKYLNVDGFGKYMIITAILGMAMLLTDFGFNLSATHSISLHREDKPRIAQLLGNIFAIKFIFAIFASMVVLIYFSINELGDSLSSLAGTLVCLTIFAQAFQCLWFFQGIERMKNITIANILTKASYLILLVILLPFSSTIEMALFSFFISQLLMIGIYIKAIYKEKYQIAIPQLKMLCGEIKHSFGFFISRVAVSTYSLLNTVIIGNISGNYMAGLYGSAEKLYGAGVSVSGMLSQALYPHMAKNNNFKLLIKIVGLTSIPYFIGCYVVSFFSEDIIVFIFGEKFKEASQFLNLFLFLMCVTFISINLGYPAFSAVKKVEYANYTTIAGAIVHMIFLIGLYLFYSLSAINVLKTVIITESIILILRASFLFYFYRRG